MYLLLRATRVARRAHEGQTRKFAGPDGRTAPYIEHPLRVMTYLLGHAEAIEGPVLQGMVDRTNAVEDVLAAAVLHDVVEDTRYTLADLHDMFPRRVVDYVQALTRLEGQSAEGYVARICRLPATAIIKAADCIDNLRDAVASAPDDFLGRLARKYRPILESIAYRLPAPIQADFAAALAAAESEIEEPAPCFA